MPEGASNRFSGYHFTDFQSQGHEALKSRLLNSIMSTMRSSNRMSWLSSEKVCENAPAIMVEVCWDSARILPRFRRDSAMILLSSAGILLGFWQDSGRILLRFCWCSAKTLLNLQQFCSDSTRFCWDSAKILSGFCSDSSRIVLRFCKDSAEILVELR